MASVINRNLTLALNQDLRELDKICHEMQLHDYSCASWSFPTKCISRSLPTNGKYSQNIPYVQYLELMLDRLYFILTVFLKVLTYFDKGSTRQNHLTLGRTVYLNWKYVQSTRQEKQTSKAKQAYNQMSLEKGSQTEYSSFQRCCSCSTSEMSIKAILNALECISKDKVMKIRQEVKQKIFTISQTSCMKMLTSVIEEIIEEFITDHTKYIEANNYLTAEIKNTRTALKEALEKVELLQAVRSDLEQKLRNEKNALEDLHRIKNDLYHTNLNKEHTISSLLAKVEECEEKRKFAELNNNYLLEEIKTVRQKCATFDVDNKFWRKKYDDAIVEQNSLKVKIDHSEIKMHNLFRQIGLIHSEIVEACFKIDAVDRNTESTMLHSKEVELRINVLESVLEKKAKVLDKSISVSPADFLMLAEGDPVKDMKSQIAFNNKEIQVLTEKNNRLYDIVSRLEFKNK